LVHRDIKPSNALLTGDDFVYLIDFGIAHDAAATRLTSTGMMVGTLAYMAPERFTAGIADARSDVYALACVLYECLTGATPYPGDSMEQQIAGHLTLDPPKPSSMNPAIPAGFDEVIATGMAKKPEQRYQGARELATAARRALTEVPTPARAPHPAPAAALLDDPTRPAPAPAARQQPDERTQPATQPHPPPPETAPPPAPSGHRQRRQALIVAIVVILAAGAGITGYLMRQPSTPSTTTAPATTTPTTTTPTTAPPVAEAALDGLLLSPGQINTAMGTTGITVDHNTTTMDDDTAQVADQACRPVNGNLLAPAYAGSGWSAFREQVLSAPGNTHPYSYWVDQGVVLFPSAHGAGAFFAASAEQWPACSNRQYTYTEAGKAFGHTVGPISNTNGTLSYTNIQEGGDGWACQRALTVANNVVIDVDTCSKNRSDSQSDAAVTIAHQIAAKGPTT
ncbi:MAG: serine/threonine-protein kinase PknH/PknJ, partial [Gemmatimonadales bacterium]